MLPKHSCCILGKLFMKNVCITNTDFPDALSKWYMIKYSTLYILWLDICKFLIIFRKFRTNQIDLRNHYESVIFRDEMTLLVLNCFLKIYFHCCFFFKATNHQNVYFWRVDFRLKVKLSPLNVVLSYMNVYLIWFCSHIWRPMMNLIRRFHGAMWVVEWWYWVEDQRSRSHRLTSPAIPSVHRVHWVLLSTRNQWSGWEFKPSNYIKEMFLKESVTANMQFSTTTAVINYFLTFSF